MKTLALSAAVLLGVSISVGAYAQSYSPPSSPRLTQSQTQQKPQQMSATTYVQNAARGDMFEIQAANTALDKTKSDSVRNFAQMMIDDHTASSEKLKSALQKSNIKVSFPKDLDKKHSGMLDRLKKASAASFDQAYLQSQLAAHRDMLNLHQGYSRNGDNDALKQLASEAATVVQKHLSQLQQMAQVKGGTQSQRQAPDSGMGGSPPAGGMGSGTRSNP
jgi:putative membrane protein